MGPTPMASSMSTAKKASHFLPLFLYFLILAYVSLYLIIYTTPPLLALSPKIKKNIISPWLTLLSGQAFSFLFPYPLLFVT